MTIRAHMAETLSDGFIKLTRHSFAVTRADGGAQTLVREVHDHGHAAAVLPVDPAARTVILVRQFRLPPYLGGDDGHMIETIAGLLDGDAPDLCARREAHEEAGIALNRLDLAFSVYASPGTLTEKVHCFIATYDRAAPRAPGGGLHAEGEDIEVIECDGAAAFDMIRSGAIQDAKTVALLQHARLAGLI